MTNLLIIGAGPNQFPAIRLAKQRGYGVAVTDMNSGADGFALADQIGVVSTRDVEATIAFAQQLHEHFPLDGVMTMASESAVTVAAVAHALGLPGTDPEAAQRATNKVVRQQHFQSHAVPAPRFARASNALDGAREAEKIGWPIVVKPVDSAGSRGVRKVNSPEEMDAAVQEIAQHSRDPEFLIEEFLTGSEHSIEGLVIEGDVFWTGFSDRNYDKKEMYAPYFLEDGDTLPTLLTPDAVERVKEVSTQAVRALGVEWGPVKGDIIVTDSTPLVIEMAARLSGDYFCYETVPLHNGVNNLDAVMDMSVGKRVDATALRPKFERGVALRYVWPKPGSVTAIRGVADVRAMPGIRFFNWEPRWRDVEVGSIIEPPRSMGERVGCVLASAASRVDAVALAEKAVKMIEIVTEPVT